MKNFSLRLGILAIVIFSITIVFFIGFKLNINPHVSSEMDRWVGIATVCTAISSAVVGLISVWVMFDQKKLQDKMMNMQIQEHQPIFKVAIITDDNNYSNEEICIKKANNNPFILVDYEIAAYAYYCYDNDKYLIRLNNYFGTPTDSDAGDEETLITTTSSVNKFTYDIDKDTVSRIDNIGYISGLNAKYPSIGINIRKYIWISYIDLYGNMQKRYFINTIPVDENEFFALRKTIKKQNMYDLGEFDIIKCAEDLKNI